MVIKIIQNETDKDGKSKNEENIFYLWDHINWSNVLVIEVPEGMGDMEIV